MARIQPRIARLLAALALALLGALSLTVPARAQAEPAWYGCDPGPARPPMPPGRPGPIEEEPLQHGILYVDATRSGPPIHGLGYNMEPTLWSCPDYHAPFDGYIMGLLRPALARVGIAQRPWAPPDAATAKELHWEVYQRELDQPGWQPSWEFLAELNQRGIEPILSLWGAPGVFTDDGRFNGRLLPEHFERYLEYYEAAIDYLVRQKGIRVLAASVMNEPDCGDGAKLTPEQYVAIARQLGPRLGPYGVPLYGPDTCNAVAGLDYLNALLEQPDVFQYFAFIGVHQYSVGPEVAQFIARARLAGLDLPIYVTEYTSFGYGLLDDGQPASDEWGFTLDNLAILASHMGAGADAALYWDAVDYLQEHHNAVTQWGLLGGPTDAAPFTPRPRYWAMLQVARELPPGSRLLDAQKDAPPSLLPLAVHKPSAWGERLSLVLVNLGGPVELEVRLHGVPADPFELRAVQSTADELLSPAGTVWFENGVGRLIVPGRSITTLLE